jgi:hypothetical protein
MLTNSRGDSHIRIKGILKIAADLFKKERQIHKNACTFSLVFMDDTFSLKQKTQKKSSQKPWAKPDAFKEFGHRRLRCCR